MVDSLKFIGAAIFVISLLVTAFLILVWTALIKYARLHPDDWDNDEDESLHMYDLKRGER